MFIYTTQFLIQASHSWYLKAMHPYIFSEKVEEFSGLHAKPWFFTSLLSSIEPDISLLFIFKLNSFYNNDLAAMKNAIKLALIRAQHKDMSVVCPALLLSSKSL